MITNFNRQVLLRFLFGAIAKMSELIFSLWNSILAISCVLTSSTTQLNSMNKTLFVLATDPVQSITSQTNLTYFLDKRYKITSNTNTDIAHLLQAVQLLEYWQHSKRHICEPASQSQFITQCIEKTLTRSSTVAVIADRAAYDVGLRHSCRRLEEPWSARVFMYLLFQTEICFLYLSDRCVFQLFCRLLSCFVLCR